MKNSLLSLTLLVLLGVTRVATAASTFESLREDPKIRIGSANIHIVFNKGARHERFHYYPGYEVYFSYHGNQYYWYDRGRWHVTRRLPRHLRHVEYERYVVISARYDRPWTYHENRWRYDERNDRWDRRDDRHNDRRWDQRDDRRRDRRDDWRDHDRDRRDDRGRDDRRRN